MQSCICRYDTIRYSGLLVITGYWSSTLFSLPLPCHHFFVWGCPVVVVVGVTVPSLLHYGTALRCTLQNCTARHGNALRCNLQLYLPYFHWSFHCTSTVPSTVLPLFFRCSFHTSHTSHASHSPPIHFYGRYNTLQAPSHHYSQRYNSHPCVQSCASGLLLARFCPTVLYRCRTVTLASCLTPTLGRWLISIPSHTRLDQALPAPRFLPTKPVTLHIVYTSPRSS